MLDQIVDAPASEINGAAALEPEAPPAPEDSDPEATAQPPESSKYPNLKSKWRYHVGSLPSDPYVAFVLFAPGENPAPFVQELFEAGHWPCMIGLYGPSEADVDAIADELLEKGHVIEMQNWDGYLWHRNVPISKGESV